MIPGPRNLWRHIIRDYLWPKKLFGEKFSYESYFFLSVNNELAKKAMICDIYESKDLHIEETVLLLSYPSRHEMSLRSQSDLHWERYLRDLSETSQKRCLFCDVFKTSQKHPKKDVFCVTSLRRLRHISKKMSFPWRLWDVSKTSLASIFGFPEIRHKNDFVWFP